MLKKEKMNSNIYLFSEAHAFGFSNVIEMVTLTSIKFESKQNKTTSRTVSFKNTCLSRTSKSDGIDKVVYEESTSCKKRKIGELTLGTNVSSTDTEGQTDDFIENFKWDDWISPRSPSELDAAAIKLQKVYKSYRTRRNLADCTVVVEELWYVQLSFAIPVVVASTTFLFS